VKFALKVLFRNLVILKIVKFPYSGVSFISVWHMVFVKYIFGNAQVIVFQYSIC